MSFIFAVLFWEKISKLKMSYVEQGFSDYLSMQMATSEILQDVNQNFYFQRKHIAGVRELCLLQARFNKFMGKSPGKRVFIPVPKILNSLNSNFREICRTLHFQ